MLSWKFCLHLTQVKAYDKMQAKRLKLEMGPTRSVTQQEMQAVKLELVALKADVQRFKTIFNDLTGLLLELKKEHNEESTSSDSGMSSETKKAVEENSNKTQVLKPVKTEVTIEPSECVKELYNSVEVRPVIPLLYGIIRHNPMKERKSAPPEMTMNETKVAVVAPSPPVSFSEPYGYLHKKKRACKQLTKNNEDNTMVRIGTGKTTVPRNIYCKINWNSYTIATRKLLVAAFSKRILATHSLTGKASPAFADKPAKLCLDPKKILDIIIEVTNKCKVKENLVRNAITTKCADEYKMMRMQAKKQNTTV